MKIVAILGSPKKKGNTARVLSLFEKKLQGEHELEIIHVARQHVGGCLGCYQCQGNKAEPGCVQQDDADAIFAKMMEADAIIYATPLYCWSFSGQLKPLIDRHFCLVTGYGTLDHKSLIGDKPAALLVTCAGPIERNCDVIQEIFKGFCEYGKLEAKGNFILPFTSTPDAIGANGEEVAENLALALIGS